MRLEFSKCCQIGVLVAGALVKMSRVGQFQVISDFFGKIAHGVDADILVKITSRTLNSGEYVGEVGVDG